MLKTVVSVLMMAILGGAIARAADIECFAQSDGTCDRVSVTGGRLDVNATAAGVADTVGADATFNANTVCATVLTAGQTGVGFLIDAGTLAGTLTPSVSEDATPASPGCTGGTWTATKFVDTDGNTAATLVLTNPNAATHRGVQTLGGTRCARVCTTAFTSGSATGRVVASTMPSPSPAPSADVTDRAGRALGVVASITNPVAVTGTFWQATQPVSIAATVTTSDTHTTAGSPLSVRLSDGASFLSQNANGQATMTNSSPTVLASDQVAADDSAAASQNLGVLPLLIETSTTLPTSTDGRRTHLLGDGDRKLYVRTYDSDPQSWNTGASTVTGDTQIAAASGASLSYYITDIFVSNHSATTISVGLVSSATAGNACATSPAVVHVPIYVKDGVGATRHLATPIKVTANHALCCDTSGSTAFTCQVHGFVAP